MSDYPPAGAPSLPPRSPVSHGLSASPLSPTGASAASGAAPAAGVPPHAAVAGAPAPPGLAQQQQQQQAPVAAAAAPPAINEQPATPGLAPPAAGGSALTRSTSTASATPLAAAPPAPGAFPISGFVIKGAKAYSSHAVAHWHTSDGRSGKTERLGGTIQLGLTAYRSLKNRGVPEGAFVRLGLEVRADLGASRYTWPGR